MKINLWLSESGQAAVAAGRPVDCWGLGIAEETLDMTTQGWLKVKSLVVLESEIPDREACIGKTLERLDEQETSLREKLNDDLARIEQMRNQILALPNYTKTEAGDDIPF